MSDETPMPPETPAPPPSAPAEESLLQWALRIQGQTPAEAIPAEPPPDPAVAAAERAAAAAAQAEAVDAAKPAARAAMQGSEGGAPGLTTFPESLDEAARTLHLACVALEQEGVAQRYLEHVQSPPGSDPNQGLRFVIWMPLVAAPRR